MKKLFITLSVTLAANWSIAQGLYDPATEAKRLFESYRPTIARTEHAAVDEPTAITGDLNSDGLTDCILYFVLTPEDGGNMVVGRKAAVYLNTGTGMKVDGAFPDLNYCFVVDKIVSSGIIYVDSYECAPPYNTKNGAHRYRWAGKKLVAVK